MGYCAFAILSLPTPTVADVQDYFGLLRATLAICGTVSLFTGFALMASRKGKSESIMLGLSTIAASFLLVVAGFGRLIR
jgi:hypothetical protein